MRGFFSFKFFKCRKREYTIQDCRCQPKNVEIPGNSNTGFRHLLFFVNSKNPVFKPFVAYFFVNFLNFICCTELYFYEKRAII